MIARNHKQEEHALQGEGCVGEGTAISATSPSGRGRALARVRVGDTRRFARSFTLPTAKSAYPHPRLRPRPLPEGEVTIGSQLRPRAGFTLVELLMVILLIGILSSFVLVALAGVNQTAKEDRTKAQIKKIHELVMERWEQYRYRRVPATRYMASARQGARANNEIDNVRMARERLNGLRELMRMELPTYISDVLKPAKFLRDPLDPNLKRVYSPALWRAYRQRATEEWSVSHQQAECLYLILSQIRDADSTALEFFKDNEIGDVDGDGMKEILDAWGNPIQWMLWAPGFTSPLQVPMSENPEQDDLFDLSNFGSGYLNINPNDGFPDRFQGTYTGSGFEIDFANLPRTLYPLIYSSGADGQFGIVLSTNESGTIDQDWVLSNNDPYDRNTNQKMFLIGATSVQQPDAMADDISNHYLTTR